MKIHFCLFFAFATSLFGEDASHLPEKKVQPPPLHQPPRVNNRFYLKVDHPPQSDSWWDNPYFLGNWQDVRGALESAGITIASSFVTDLNGNPKGGNARGFAYAGTYGFSIDVDFSQAGLKGLEIYASACWRTGTNLSQTKIDNQFNVAQVYGSQTVKLCDLYIAQRFFDDRLELKAGRLDAGSDFLSSPLYWKYLNAGIDGNPESIFFNVPFTVYPNATWGAYIKGRPFKWLSGQCAIYNANTTIQKNKYHGINFTFKNTNGVLWITEWCALVNQELEDGGMPGNYKAGFFYLTGGNEKPGDPCFYLLFDQMIYQQGGSGSNRGLTSFLTLLFQPKDRNLFPFFTTFGLIYQGMFLSRPDDTVSFGLAYGKYSSDRAEIETAEGKQTQNFEAVLELNYWIQINQWMNIVPDLQYIIHPLGLNTPNAWVAGLQLSLILW